MIRGIRSCEGEKMLNIEGRVVREHVDEEGRRIIDEMDLTGIAYTADPPSRRERIREWWISFVRMVRGGGRK